MLMLQSKFLSLYRCYQAITRLISHTTQRELIGLTHELNCVPVGLFCIPDLVQAKDFMRLTNKKIKLSQHIVNEIINTPYANEPKMMLYRFDRLSSELCSIADPSNFLQTTLPASEIKSAAGEACLAINSYIDTLNTNHALYSILKQCVIEFSHNWNQEEQRVATLLLNDFEVSGVHLGEKLRTKVIELQSKEMRLGMEFFSHSLTPAKRGEWVMEDGHIMSLYSHIRKLVYTTYNSRDGNRSSSLFQLINTRNKLARFLGYDSAADRTIVNSMAGNVSTVETLLHSCAQLLKPIALEQVQAARDTVISLLGENNKQKTPQSAQCGKIHIYDGSFYINYARNNIWKQQSTSIDSSSSLNSTLAEFFPLKNCLEAINIICQSLFKMNFEPLSVKRNETWHPSVIKAGLIDSEGLQGLLYLDLMNRPYKPDIECHQLVQGSRKDELNRFQIPVAALACNFSPPSAASSQLVSPSNLCSFFHEMGHALHSLLGRTKFQHVAGTRCPTDLGEIPSNLMEYFSSDKRFLRLFARHYITDKVIPDNFIHLLIQRAHSYEAYATYIQVMYAILDIMLHKREFENEDEMLQLENEVYSKYGLYLPEDSTSWMLRFSHLSNYGSRYYSYTWAKAFSSLIWQKKFVKDPLSAVVGEQYKKLFLSRGYGTDPWIMVEEFLGFKPTTNDLVAAILLNVKEDTCRIQKEDGDYSNQDFDLKWQNWNMISKPI